LVGSLVRLLVWCARDQSERDPELAGARLRRDIHSLDQALVRGMNRSPSRNRDPLVGQRADVRGPAAFAERESISSSATEIRGAEPELAS